LFQLVPPLWEWSIEDGEIRLKGQEDEIDRLIVISGLEGIPILTVRKASNVSKAILKSEVGRCTEVSTEEDARKIIRFLWCYIPALTLEKFLLIIREEKGIG